MLRIVCVALVLCCAGGCASTHNPEPESATVTIPLPRVEYSEPQFPTIEQ
jgi:hypothetical protein